MNVNKQSLDSNSNERADDTHKEGYQCAWEGSVVCRNQFATRCLYDINPPSLATRCSGSHNVDVYMTSILRRWQLVVLVHTMWMSIWHQSSVVDNSLFRFTQCGCLYDINPPSLATRCSGSHNVDVYMTSILRRWQLIVPVHTMWMSIWHQSSVVDNSLFWFTQCGCLYDINPPSLATRCSGSHNVDVYMTSILRRWQLVVLVHTMWMSIWHQSSVLGNSLFWFTQCGCLYDIKPPSLATRCSGSHNVDVYMTSILRRWQLVVLVHTMWMFIWHQSSVVGNSLFWFTQCGCLYDINPPSLRLKCYAYKLSILATCDKDNG